MGFFIGEGGIDFPSPDPGKRSLLTPGAVLDDKKVSFSFGSEGHLGPTESSTDDVEDDNKDPVKFVLGEYCSFI